MKEKIVEFITRAEISQEISKRANEMIDNNHTEYFTTGQLRMIAELSDAASIEATREARNKLKEWEEELDECKQMFDQRRWPLYGDSSKDKCKNCTNSGYCDHEEEQECGQRLERTCETCKYYAGNYGDTSHCKDCVFHSDWEKE